MIQKRKALIVNKTFQFRFAFYLCTILTVLTLAYPLIIMMLFDYFFEYLAHDPTGPGLERLNTIREELIALLIFMECIFFGLAFFIALFISHRIAGPIQKLLSLMKNAKDGFLNQRLSFREKDYFPELPLTYNEMMASFQKKIENQQNGISEAVSSIEKIVTTDIKLHDETKKTLEQTLVHLRIVQKT